MGHSLSDPYFDRPAVPLYLAHQHSALNRCNAEISQFLLVSFLGQPSLCFLVYEECCELVFDNFEDEADVLSDQFVVSVTSFPIAITVTLL